MMPLVMARAISRSAWNIVINHKGQVLVARRSRKSNNPKQWNFPGGGIESAEQPFESAIRELKEEMGIKRGQLELIGSQDVSTRDRNMYVFIWGLKQDKAPDMKINKKESDKVLWLTMKKLESETRNPKQWHFPTFMILHNPLLFENLKILCKKRVDLFGPDKKPKSDEKSKSTVKSS